MFILLMLITVNDLIILNKQVFGLGNKTYEHYNKVAIYVDKRLEELGASRVFELGLGDDDAKQVFKIRHELRSRLTDVVIF